MTRVTSIEAQVAENGDSGRVYMELCHVIERPHFYHRSINKKSRIYGTSDQPVYLSISFAKCESPRWEAVGVRGGRPKWEAEVGGRARPKWEAVGVRGGRPRKSKVEGCRSPRWEAARGRSGRPWESEVGDRGSPRWEAREAEVGG